VLPPVDQGENEDLVGAAEAAQIPGHSNADSGPWSKGSTNSRRARRRTMAGMERPATSPPRNRTASRNRPPPLLNNLADANPSERPLLRYHTVTSPAPKARPPSGTEPGSFARQSQDLGRPARRMHPCERMPCGRPPDRSRRRA
jgi:hypothetical protein